MRPCLFFILLTFSCVAFIAPHSLAHSPAQYNVTFTTPSSSAYDSVPLGNGEVAVNAWFDENCDLMLLLSRTDAWDEYGELLKIGRLRISLDSHDRGVPFKQSLHLEDGTLRAEWGEGQGKKVLLLYVDANAPVVRLFVESQSPSVLSIKTENWRRKKLVLAKKQVSDVLNGKPRPHYVFPDKLMNNLPAGMLGWYHHNHTSVGPEMLTKLQGLEGFPRKAPLLHRTFGALVKMDGSKYVQVEKTKYERVQGGEPEKVEGKALLVSPSSTLHTANIFVTALHPSTPEAFTKHTLALAKKDTGFLKNLKAHKEWWKTFWDRSWIDVTEKATDVKLPTTSAVEEDISNAFRISRAYACQRYVNACAGRGNYPIKFNGSLFCVGTETNPDVRRWGPGYWWQNTRWAYCTMCTSGDYEMMQPLFKMYVYDLLDYWKFKALKHTGHKGLYLQECAYFWGDGFPKDYGWTPASERKGDKFQDSGYHKYEWLAQMELAWLALDLFEHTGEKKALDEIVFPLVEGTFTFFEQQYKKDAAGKLVMEPSQAAETWWQCTNPMTEVSGLRGLCRRLLELAPSLTSEEQRKRWKTFLTSVPELPTVKKEGVTMLAPGAKFANKRNCENPELYCVFPFREITFNTKDEKKDWALAAYKNRLHRLNFGWCQDSLFAAHLGLADEAGSLLLRRVKHVDSRCRFPAMWKSNFNELPDQDHGNTTVATLQSMLMQCDGGKIYLLPAWPQGWDVAFKLHAPGKTTVVCEVKEGKVTRLDITPKERKKDVVICE